MNKELSTDEIKIVAEDRNQGIEARDSANKNSLNLWTVRFIRNKYSQFKKGKVNGIYPKYLKAFSEMTGMPIDLKIQKRPSRRGIKRRSPIDLEEIRDLIAVVEGKKKKEEYLQQYKRGVKRLEFLIGFYIAWKKSGIVYKNHDKIAKLFAQVTGLSIPEQPSEQPIEEKPERVEELKELDEVFEEFRQKLAEAIIKTSQKISQKETSEAYQAGYEEGKKSGEENYRKQTISSLVLGKLFKKEDNEI